MYYTPKRKNRNKTTRIILINNLNNLIQQHLRAKQHIARSWEILVIIILCQKLHLLRHLPQSRASSSAMSASISVPTSTRDNYTALAWITPIAWTILLRHNNKRKRAFATRGKRWTHNWLTQRNAQSTKDSFACT